MDAVILPKSDVEAIKGTLQEMKEHLKNITSPTEHFVNNEEFVKLMGVSPRTAQVWRDEGKIGYSQNGKKLYYRMSDIERFLEVNHKAPFAEMS